MGVTDVQHQVLALFGSTVTNTVDLQFLLVGLIDTHDHVVQQGAGEAVEASVRFVVSRTLDSDLGAVLLDHHIRVQLLGQGTLGALDGNNVARGDADFHASGDGNGHSTNSTHVKYPPYQTNARTSPPT